MIYPKNFEQKIGFDEIRALLRKRCLSTLGKEKVDEIAFSSDVDTVNELLCQVKEFRRLREETEYFPMQYFFDVRESVARLRLEGTHMDEAELFDLRRSMETICTIVKLMACEEEDTEEREERREKKKQRERKEKCLVALKEVAQIKAYLFPPSTLHHPQKPLHHPRKRLTPIRLSTV